MRANNPGIPKQLGDAIRCEVVFPMEENFFDLVHAMHDSTFGLEVGEEIFECTLNQDMNPIKLNFPDIETSPALVFASLQVYCDLDDILKIKKSNKLKLKL